MLAVFFSNTVSEVGDGAQRLGALGAAVAVRVGRVLELGVS